MITADDRPDTHIPSYGNPGVGYSVFWRRALLVIIGFAAGAIVTFIPKPPSATRDVANTLARNLRRIKDLHALFLTTFYAPPSDLTKVVEANTLAAAEAIDSLGPRIPTLKYEFTSTNLDPKTLSQVIKHSVALNQSIAQLFTYATTLSPDLKTRFAHFCVVQDTRLAGDIMAVLTLLEQTLKAGDPLPAMLPTPLMGRMIDYVSL